MRTQKEILKKIEEVTTTDFFGVMLSDLLEFLSFKNAKKYLKEEVTKTEWDAIYKNPTKINIKNKMKDYLNFAFEKAEDRKGLSANRSMDHYTIWIWLLDEEKKFKNLSNYNDYGIQNLNKIKKYLQIH